jgi:hypothetical protein
VSTPNIRSAASAKQRRSQRILLSVPLEVSGKRSNGVAFREDASTFVVNAHGGLLLLKEVVFEGQILTLKHTRTTEEISCTVMNIGAKANGVTEVGIEFSKPNPKFWRVSFPPEDWTPQSADAKPVTFNPRSFPTVKPQPAKK